MQLKTWLLMKEEARQNSWSFLEMTQSLLGFRVLTMSVPVHSTIPQTLFCQEVSYDLIVTVKDCRAASSSPEPEPSEGDRSQDGQVHAGKTLQKSQWLNIISSSLSLSFCLSLSSYMSSAKRCHQKALLITVTQGSWLKWASFQHVLLQSP